jgi:CRISPR/Cas system-associated exonuclease Cas4 (RecB family)
MANRNYPKNGYPSVTEVTGQLRSYGLEWFFKSHSLREINDITNKAKKVGTQMHEVIQTYIETGEAKVDTEYAEEITNTLKSFMLFRKEHPQYELRRSEISMSSDKLKLNGQLDCLAHDGELLIADWKSANAKDKDIPAIYDNYKTQVSAYLFMYNELFYENVKSAIIVSLAKDKVAYNYYRMDWDEVSSEFHKVFLPLLTISHYRKGITNEIEHG